MDYKQYIAVLRSSNSTMPESRRCLIMEGVSKNPRRKRFSALGISLVAAGCMTLAIFAMTADINSKAKAAGTSKTVLLCNHNFTTEQIADAISARSIALRYANGFSDN